MPSSRHAIRPLALLLVAAALGLAGCGTATRSSGRGAVVDDDYRPQPRRWPKPASPVVFGRVESPAIQVGGKADVPADVAASMVARANRGVVAGQFVAPPTSSVAVASSRRRPSVPDPRPPSRVLPGFDPTS